MKTIAFTLGLLIILFFSKSCTETQNKNGYKVLVYGYSFGERNENPSYVEKEVEFDSFGNIISVTGEGKITKSTYDEKGNLISKTEYEINEDGSSDYNDGLIIRKENFEYDDLNRVKRRLVYSEKGKLIVSNNLTYYGDTLVIEDGIGTDLSDDLIYQGVTSQIDDPSIKYYSDNPYWVITRMKDDQKIRMVVSELSGFTSLPKIIDYSYDQYNRITEKVFRTGFDKPKEIEPFNPDNRDRLNYRVIEPETELKTPDINESWLLLTKKSEGKIEEINRYEYNEDNSLVLRTKDVGDVKIFTRVSYPNEFTEVREYSGYPYDFSNIKEIFIYDENKKLMSIESFSSLGDPIEFKEYVYSR